MQRPNRVYGSLSRLNSILKERSNGMSSNARDPQNYLDKPFYGQLSKDLPDMEEGTSVHFYIDDSANMYRIKMFALVQNMGMISNTIPFEQGPETIARVSGNKKFTLDELKEKFAEADDVSDDLLPW